jgi:hypothetical protein
MGWVGHVACMERSKIHAGSWWRNLKGRDHSENLGTDGTKIIIIIN